MLVIDMMKVEVCVPKPLASQALTMLWQSHKRGYISRLRGQSHSVERSVSEEKRWRETEDTSEIEKMGPRS